MMAKRVGRHRGQDRAESRLARRAIAVGECMVELSRGDDGRFSLAYGGDTFNTAVYLARAGIHTAYATALGDDLHSDAIVALAQAEAIATEAIVRAPGRVPGLYMIETDAGGERRFLYWRENAPARDLFGSLASADVLDAIACAGLVYFSGVTLWLYRNKELDMFLAAIAAARTVGARVAFDPNYRPRLWGADTSRAQRIFAKAMRLADVALPTFDDEKLLWGDGSPEQTLDRLAAAGIGEIALKLGKDGALLRHAGSTRHVPAPAPKAVVDTTGAGDSFNAAYLATRIRGGAPAEAAAFGHRLAGIVIGHRGAIGPRQATAGLMASAADGLRQPRAR